MRIFPLWVGILSMFFGREMLIKHAMYTFDWWAIALYAVERTDAASRLHKEET